MGNIMSGDEKSSKNKIKRKNLNKIDWINDQYGYHQIRKEDLRFRGRRNTSFHFKNGSSEFSKPKSHSLDAIFEELYLSGTEDSSIQDTGPLFNYRTSRPFIPRIKLTRSVSNLKEEKRYKLFKMSTKPDILHFEDSQNSSNKTIHLKEEDEEKNTGDSIEYLNNNNNNNNDDDYAEAPKKPDENYFAKNFDECMKRLQLIEKEHELIEKVDSNIQLYFLKDQPVNEGSKSEEVHNSSVDVKNEDEVDNTSSLRNLNEKEEAKTYEEHDNLENAHISNSTFHDDESETNENQQSITQWYSTVKQHFEKGKSEEQNPKEMSCRITGATLKSSSEIQKTDDRKEETRHYFSRLVKSNKSLIDEELPDPDKVKNIRAMFQENLNSTLKRNLDKKLGGSLQNISMRSGEQHLSRPLSALCNRDDVIEEIRENHKAEDKKDKQFELLEFKDSEKEFQIEATKRKLFEKYDKDLKIGKDFRSRKLLQPKWTDTGSMSSGVSSDLSSYDTDIDSYSKDGPEPEPEPDEVTISDDDLLDEVKDKHYVQNEILEKIRSFGTSVTYYGGEMITCSVGPLLSPTAQAIMEEIGEKYGSEASPTRSFEEFYRKYVETNEPNRKKKLGRARSFGQKDMFQRPNVLSNTEIEMYKNDLELEIGIKKPTGIPQNGLKLKLAKSNSLDSRSETSEKIEKKLPETPIITIDVISENENESKNQSFEDSESVESNKDKSLGEEIKCKEEKEDFENVKSCENEVIPVSTSIEKDDVKEISEERNERKERFLERSISAPEGLKNANENSELPSKEILFGYEKSLLNGKRKSDMEFEEFEVCESVTEKLEKLKEVNASGYQNSIENETSSKDVEVNKTKTETELRRKWNINLNEESENNNNNNESVSFETEKVQANEEKSEEVEQIGRPKPILNRSQSDIKYTRHSQSRWPIETTVMVDIQKNNEQTPKVILNGKTSKTKLRLF